MTSHRPPEKKNRLTRSETWVSLFAGIIAVLTAVLTFFKITNIDDLGGRHGNPETTQTATATPEPPEATSAPGETTTPVPHPTPQPGGVREPTRYPDDSDRSRDSDIGDQPVIRQPANRSQTSARLSVNPNPVSIGDFWSINVSGFPPYAAITIYADGKLIQSFSADESGSFKRSFPPLTRDDCTYSNVEFTAALGVDPYATATARFC